MRKIKIIVMSTVSIAVSAVMFYMGQQRSLVNAIVSSNVEALVLTETINGVEYHDMPLHVKDLRGNHMGYTSTNGETIPGNDMWKCWNTSTHSDADNGKCWSTASYRIEMTFY